MAYAADALAYEVLSDLASREMKGSVRVLGIRYILPRGMVWQWVWLARQ